MEFWIEVVIYKEDEDKSKEHTPVCD